MRRAERLRAGVALAVLGIVRDMVGTVLIPVLVSILAALLVGVVGWLRRRMWQRMWRRAKEWCTERKTRRAQVAATKRSVQDGILYRHCLVVARFQSLPSRRWRDPVAEVQGIRDGRRVVSLPSPLRYEGWNGAPLSVEAGWVPLCIPGLSVEADWRGATQVRADPLWRSLKRHVVDKFLGSAAGHTFVCRVFPGREPGGFLLNCPQYDQHLHNEWPYFKGLEEAFSVNALYRQKQLQDMTDGQLKDFVFVNLLTLLDRATIDRVPRQYRQPLQSRAPAADAAYLVLKGLIERYRASGMPPLAT